MSASTFIQSITISLDLHTMVYTMRCTFVCTPWGRGGGAVYVCGSLLSGETTRDASWSLHGLPRELEGLRGRGLVRRDARDGDADGILGHEVLLRKKKLV